MKIFSRHFFWVFLILVSVLMSSCIKDELSPCSSGVSVRLVYDYNMLYANAFQNSVDCLDLFVFDAEGNFVTSQTAQGDVLKDEAYRVVLKLNKGDYTLIAYGGLACSRSSFNLSVKPEDKPMISSLMVTLKDAGKRTSDVQLHNLYYGIQQISVKEDLSSITQEETVHMMRDTKNLRIVLQQVSGEPVNPADFIMSVTADNTKLDYLNYVLQQGTPHTYSPWKTGQQSAGQLTADKEVITGWAEFSFPRLMDGRDVRLTIMNRESGKDVVNIPLIKYLLLSKSQAHSSMDNQEFLDRQSEWEIVFFLTEGTWLETAIVINGWTVHTSPDSDL